MAKIQNKMRKEELKITFFFSILISLLISTLILLIVLTISRTEEIDPLKERISYLENKLSFFDDYQEVCIKNETITEKWLIETNINKTCMEEKTMEYFTCLRFLSKNPIGNKTVICVPDRESQYDNRDLARELDCLELAHLENITRTYCTEKSLIKKGKWGLS